jgi:hypothetical protein
MLGAFGQSGVFRSSKTVGVEEFRLLDLIDQPTQMAVPLEKVKP